MTQSGFGTAHVRPIFSKTLTADTGNIVIATAEELQPGAVGVDERRPRKLRIIAADLNLSGAGTATFRSGVDDVGNLRRSADNLSVTLPRNADGWFDDGNDGQQYTLGVGTLTVTGTIIYVKM